MNSNNDSNEPEGKKNPPYVNHKKVRNEHKQINYKDALYNAKDDIRDLETGIQEAIGIIRDGKDNGENKAKVIEDVERKLLELYVRRYR